MNNNKVLAIQFDPERIIFGEDGMIYLKIDSEETFIRFDMFNEQGSRVADTLSAEIRASTKTGIEMRQLAETPAQVSV